MIKDSVRKPVVAGQFYHSDAGKLKEQLSGFFKNVKTASRSVGVVSPHAGFMYSGQTAAWAIASLKSARTFIILGPNHNTLGEQFSCFPSGPWETPLGRLEVNKNIADQLMKSCGFLSGDTDAHAVEHSIEVQLPFLQHRFGRQGFDFVPISIMNIDYSEGFAQACEKLGKAIGMVVKSSQSKTNGPNSIGIIASSDFSHYVPKVDADAMDKRVVEQILKLDVQGLFKALDSMAASVCGYGPIAVLMAAARALGLKGKPIHNSTSGDITGDNKSVVAYYAIGFE